MLPKNNPFRMFNHDLDKSGHIRESIIELFQFKGHVVISYDTIGDIGDSARHEDGDSFAIYLARDIADRYIVGL